MRKFLQFLRESIRHQEMVLVGFLAGIGVLFIPLQHYMPLARYQHFSFSLMAIAVGFLLQTVISWRGVSIWGKLTLLGSCLFVGAFAHYFWDNPWLSNPDLATDNQLFGRHVYANQMLIASLPLAFVWLRWSFETRSKKLKATATKERTEP